MKITDLLTENLTIDELIDNKFEVQDSEHDDEKTLVVGVVGISEDNIVDESILIETLGDVFDEIEEEFVDEGEFENIAVVSKANARGIHRVAFQLSEESGYETIGLLENEETEDEDSLYDTDEIIYIPEDYEEDQFFIEGIDVLVIIGNSPFGDVLLEMAESDDMPVFQRDI